MFFCQIYFFTRFKRLKKERDTRHGNGGLWADHCCMHSRLTKVLSQNHISLGIILLFLKNCFVFFSLLFVTIYVI